MNVRVLLPDASAASRVWQSGVPAAAGRLTRGQLASLQVRR